MRLYLSSFRLGECAERLVQLARGGKRVAVIANAIDIYAPEERTEGVELEMTALSELGLQPEEFDLRRYFGGKQVIADLQRYDIVWVRGGDVFTLRHALARAELTRRWFSSCARTPWFTEATAPDRASSVRPSGASNGSTIPHA